MNKSEVCWEDTLYLRGYYTNRAGRIGYRIIGIFVWYYLLYLEIGLIAKYFCTEDGLPVDEVVCKRRGVAPVSTLLLSLSTAVDVSFLSRALAPEYIQTRDGPRGTGKLLYLDSGDIVSLANYLFGYDGWSYKIV